ncbi:MAG: hypothetical protein SWY16_04750 [Cyanobacteriota bacterium]|nr:hypothetical protein [Cyanobacteriota bacterium]
MENTWFVDLAPVRQGCNPLGKGNGKSDRRSFLPPPSPSYWGG